MGYPNAVIHGQNSNGINETHACVAEQMYYSNQRV